MAPPVDMRGGSELGVQLRSLVTVLQSSASSLLPSSAGDLLYSIVEAAAMIFGAGAASIALLRDDGRQLEFVTSYGSGADQVVGQKIPSDRGIAGYVAMTGQAMAISEVEKDPRFDSEFASSTGYVPRSVLAAPLEQEDRIIGVMEVLDKVDASGFALDDLELMELFSHQAAIAIEQSELLRSFDRMLQLGLVSLAEANPDLAIDAVIDEVTTIAALNDMPEEWTELTRSIGSLYSAGPRERQVCLEVLAAVSRYSVARRRLG